MAGCAGGGSRKAASVRLSPQSQSEAVLTNRLYIRLQLYMLTGASRFKMPSWPQWQSYARQLQHGCPGRTTKNVSRIGRECNGCSSLGGPTTPFGALAACIAFAWPNKA